MREITEGVAEPETASVEGLEPGEVIATDNFNKLADGMKVNLRQPLGEGQKGAGGNKKHRPDKDKAQENPS